MASPSTYGVISRINHWLIAIAMIGMLAFGLYLEYGGLERSARGPLIGIHRSIGVLVLVYGLWRVAWRLLEGFPPPASATGPSWQESAAKFAHWSLLAGVLIMPLSGIAFTVFRGRSIDVFGWFTLPAQAEIPWIVSVASEMHSVAGKAITLIVIIHIGAALKHHFIDKDPTLDRMLKG